MADGAPMGDTAGLSRAVVPLLTEIGDLKRVVAAHMQGSFATGRFLTAWGRLAAGEPADEVAYPMLAEAVACARLGALDAERLGALGLDEAARRVVFDRALDEFEGMVAPSLADRLRESMPLRAPAAAPPAPAFAHALARQPRAGVTCPGRARVMLQPEENHAEHSYAVAVYAGLLAPDFGADPATAFWYGMVHHLHSAAMPDAGFTGEVLLGDRLGGVIDEARRQALSELPDEIAARARTVFPAIDADTTPEARAFHAADVIDRVLEIQYHTRANGLTMDQVLGEYELVHDGPVKAFHDRVLAAVSLP